jgi:hypothetical protein
MILKISISCFSLFICSFLMSQDKTPLNNQDGIYVTYELTKIETTSKKDTYIAVVKAENKNTYDVFYGVPLLKQANGTTTASISANKSFAQTSVRNATGLFGENINLTGNQTTLITNDNKLLFSVPKGEFITLQNEFKVKSGIKPVLSNQFLVPLKKIDFFTIELDETLINGVWVSDCGNVQMVLTLIRDQNGKTVIQQSVNGKLNNWVKTNTILFEKSTDYTVTLSFNKQAASFTYFNTDGVSCTWRKQ